MVKYVRVKTRAIEKFVIYEVAESKFNDNIKAQIKFKNTREFYKFLRDHEIDEFFYDASKKIYFIDLGGIVYYVPKPPRKKTASPV